ncbi:MAG TPA: ferritin family protein [Syntrophobacteraceae bacterium]|nr:ferritin family protein [Syntrophobacteraceae bacterium]
MLFCFNAAEVFQIAVEIEENGKAFYDKARELVTDPEVKKLFADLALEEVSHKKKFEDFKAQLPSGLAAPTVSDPQHELDLYIKMMADQHVFRTTKELDAQVSKIQSAADALKLAIQFEKDSVLFFLSMQEATCEGKGRDLVTLLVKEEQEHVRRLSLQLRKITHSAG